MESCTKNDDGTARYRLKPSGASIAFLDSICGLGARRHAGTQAKQMGWGERRGGPGGAGGERGSGEPSSPGIKQSSREREREGAVSGAA